MQPVAISPQSLTVLSAIVVTLFAKGVVLSYLQVRSRFRSRRYALPEDARLVGVLPQPEPQIVERIQANWRNELENTPIFLLMATCFVLLGGGATPLAVVSAGYLPARVLHAIAQLRALQPYRTLWYLCGLLASAVLAGLLCQRAWSAAS